MELPKRKPTRLKDYDYSQNGYYFITICTKNKEKILYDIVGEGLRALPTIRLSNIGKTVDDAINYINEQYVGVSVDKYAIMPNHIHMIIKFERQTGGHGDPPLQSIIGNFKSFTTHKSGTTLWQRSFHDHVIRGEQDYKEIWQYIDTNPARWTEDKFYTE